MDAVVVVGSNEHAEGPSHQDGKAPEAKRGSKEYQDAKT
jgi:hypothetical protein